MELLAKKCAHVVLFMVLAVNIQAQVNPSKVFESSYALEAKGNYKGAIHELASLNGYDYHASIRLGWLHFLSKDYELSISYYEKAVKIRPLSVEALLGLCAPLEVLKKTDRLQAVYQEILRIDPMNSKINYAMGNTYYYKKNFAMAEKHYDIVVSMYPFDYYSNLMAAWTKYFLGKKNEAQQLFNTVLIISPNDASAKEGLGLIK